MSSHGRVYVQRSNGPEPADPIRAMVVLLIAPPVHSSSGALGGRSFSGAARVAVGVGRDTGCPCRSARAAGRPAPAFVSTAHPIGVGVGCSSTCPAEGPRGARAHVCVRARSIWLELDGARPVEI